MFKLTTFFLFIYICSFSISFAQEDEIGTWNQVPGSVLVIKQIEGKKWLLQTDKNRSFYVVRGANFLDDTRVKLNGKSFNRSELANDKVTGIGGLLPAASGKTPAQSAFLMKLSQTFKALIVIEMSEREHIQPGKDGCSGFRWLL